MGIPTIGGSRRRQGATRALAAHVELRADFADRERNVELPRIEKDMRPAARRRGHGRVGYQRADLLQRVPAVRTGVLDVDIEHNDAAGAPGRHADQGIGVFTPPGLDRGGVGGSVVEAVGRQRCLAAAWENRPPSCGIAKRGVDLFHRASPLRTECRRMGRRRRSRARRAAGKPCPVSPRRLRACAHAAPA
jgi:hypothetical protein